MGGEQMLDDAEYRRDQEIADELGISYDELQSTDWEILDHDTNDGMVIGHYIQFSDNSPEEILNKIEGLDKTSKTIDINLQEPGDDDEEDDSDDDAPDGDNGFIDLPPDVAKEIIRKKDEGEQEK